MCIFSIEYLKRAKYIYRHSGEVTNAERYSFNFSHIEGNVPMLEWMLLSESVHAIYSENSGFRP